MSDSESESDDEVPLAARKQAAAAAGNGAGSKRKAPPAADEGGEDPEEEVEDGDDEDDDEEEEEEESESESDDDDDDDDSDEELTLAQRRKAKTPTKSPAKKKQKGNGGGVQPKTVKKGPKMWDTLEHEGVLFPPLYEPHGIKMKYDGEQVTLTPAEEEVATMFATMLETEYIQKPAFIKNFWEGFRNVLTPETKKVLKEFDKCDFSPIHAWVIAERDRKKAIPNAEKKAAKEAETKAVEKYTWCTMNGRREKVGNFRVEPPGLFRGRGEHPKMGRVKRRIMPEDVTINIGKDAKVPVPPEGHRWGAVIHNQHVTWLAGWRDSINEKDWKYVQLGATSSVKGDSDLAKYEKARKLHKYVGKIRADYKANFKSKDMVVRQLACTVYLIDKLALRAGGEKDEDLADTVGVCTLRVGHLEFVGSTTVKFDFLGKDSIRYLQDHEVDPAAFECLQSFCKGKKKEQDVFDQIDPTKVNAHLKTLMDGLTIKVFRTYNASVTLNRLLKQTDASLDVKGKKAHYESANKEVAILCNHQKGVSKNHDQQMAKANEKIAALKAELKELEKDKSDKGRIKVAGMTEKIEKAELNAKMKDELKTVSLGTSKINYLDPRITVAWCKRNEVPLNQVYTKALIEKFNWSMEVEPRFDFTA